MIADEHAPQTEQGCREAAMIGWRVLEQGGTALAAVEAAVRALEDNPVFNAGTGSCLNREGKIEMDAGIMEGHTLNMGAVAGIERIKHPITAARHVLESPHVMLISKGAQQFALEQGMTLCAEEDLLTERQYQAWKEGRSVGLTISADDHDTSKKHGTVGAVAIDGFGILAAATSTGGFMNKVPGRVGDSPLVGCGFYADEYAAISCTGYGEDFTRLLLARRAAEFVARGETAQQAADAAIAFLRKRAGEAGGLIVVDHQGQIGFAKNARNMAYAYLSEDTTNTQSGV
ncbi:MAG: isoaspartyl peptidase/L-asparaginase [Ktedonobacteraceae bacterium]